jgi:menaquinone-dependent protoporphyrinogen oxidase
MLIGRRYPMKILVAYASRHGATKGIAEHIAQTLERTDLDVTLRPVEDVGPVDEYGAFVIGSAAYLGGWLSQATAFVRSHHDTLADRPVWLFSSGPVGPEKVDPKGRDQLAAAEPKEFEEFARTIRPRGQRVFFGAYDPNAAPAGMAEGLMTKFMRLMPAARNALPSGDFRDWPAIEAWAEEIARELQPVGAKA